MADFMDMLNSLGRGVANVAAVPLTGLAMAEAARQGRDPRTVLDSADERAVRQQQAALIRATAMQDPAAQAYLTQNPDVAHKLFNLPLVPREQATPEMLERGGFAAPGGPTTGTPPPQLPVFPPQVETAGKVKLRQLESQAKTQATLGQVFQQLLGEVGGGGGGAPVMGGGGGGVGPGTVNIGGVPMRPVPSISPSGGLGLSFQQPPAPIKMNAPTARRLGKASGDTIDGRKLIVTEPDATSQTRFKQEWAGKVDEAAKDVEDAVKGLGDYSAPTAWLRTGKTALGMADPQWKDFTAKADLLGTALMNVHVGARGSEGMMQHFVDGLIGATHQSPENVMAAVKVIRNYLGHLKEGTDADTALMDAMRESTGKESSTTSAGPPSSLPTAPAGWTITKVR